MTKKFGFTLAEVLITLGIIGVVAAMTIPTLIANTNGAKFRSQFKKTISTLNQAGLMGLAQYDFDYAGAASACGDVKANNVAVAGGQQDPNSALSFCSLLNGTLTGQQYIGSPATLKKSDDTAYAFVSRKTLDETIGNYIAYTLADGSMIAFNKDAASCTLPLGKVIDATILAANNKDGDGKTQAGLKNCLGFIDVNGTTLPNKEVTCSDGTATLGGDVCTVPNDAAHMTDIFPIVFHDATVEPATNAAKYVLTTSK